MKTHHSRRLRRGAEPYAVRGAGGLAADPAQNRRFSHLTSARLRIARAAVLTRSERRCSSSASDDEVGGNPSAIRAERAKRVEQSNRAWWLPATIAHPAFAAMLNADSRPRRPGLLVCRHTQPFPMNLVNRLRITKAAETIVAAARDLGVSISPSSPLLDARSESAWESIMRVLHQAAEIPVTPQQEIFDEEGRFIARVDPKDRRDSADPRVRRREASRG